MQINRNGQRVVYLDNAAATPVAPQVFKAMEPYFVNSFGNPSALYKLGVEASKALENSRKSIASVLGAQPDQIIFTSGGTESCNLAIFGISTPGLKQSKFNHLITTPVEHNAVLESIAALKKQGYEVSKVLVDESGLVKPTDLLSLIRPETVLISVMYANNEIGTIEPIADIGRAIVRYRTEHKTPYPYFHVDACQAAGFLSLQVEKLHVDLLSFNASKIYGPKGVGALYVRRGVKLSPQILGGSQEHNVRAGTENIPAIVGLAVALNSAQKLKNSEVRKTQKLAEYFLQKLITNQLITKNSLNGPPVGERRLPNNVNVTFRGIDAEALVLYLDSRGIACSTGSACTTVSAEPSHVLAAIGKSAAEVASSVRFSLGRSTKKSDIDYVIKQLMMAIKLAPKL